MSKLPAIRRQFGNSFDGNFEAIALAVMHGREDRLTPEQLHMLDMTRDAYRIVCEYPNKSEAVKIMVALHPEVTERTAFSYINQGIKIWNPSERLEREFLNTVFLTSLLKEIKREDSDASTRAKNLATLQRYLAAMPQEPMDPEMMEKHTINIQLNINGNTITVPAEQWERLKENRIIAAALDQEISEAQAVEIMEG